MLEWTEAQKASERLAGQLLAAEGFDSIDPAHPLGGPDGLRDLVCRKDGHDWAVAVYFPRGQKAFNEIEKKFKHDAGVLGGGTYDGFVFLTNQHLAEAERGRLREHLPDYEVELFHLERTAAILDRPENYGLRFEYLDIEMSKAEQVAFFESLTQTYQALEAHLRSLASRSEGGVELGSPVVSSAAGYVTLDQLDRLSMALGNFVGSTSSIVLGSMVSPLQRLESVTDRLEKALGFLGYDTGTAVVISPLDRLEKVTSELKRVLDQLDRLGHGDF